VLTSRSAEGISIPGPKRKKEKKSSRGLGRCVGKGEDYVLIEIRPQCFKPDIGPFLFWRLDSPETSKKIRKPVGLTLRTQFQPNPSPTRTLFLREFAVLGKPKTIEKIPAQGQPRTLPSRTSTKKRSHTGKNEAVTEPVGGFPGVCSGSRKRKK